MTDQQLWAVVTIDVNSGKPDRAWEFEDKRVADAFLAALKDRGVVVPLVGLDRAPPEPA